VNGEKKEFSETLSLEQLVTELDLHAKRVAIEVNGEVVRRSDWNATLVKDGDRLEIVHFVGGG
jgi:thiamine biosynthesis protein ThiS